MTLFIPCAYHHPIPWPGLAWPGYSEPPASLSLLPFTRVCGIQNGGNLKRYFCPHYSNGKDRVGIRISHATVVVVVVGLACPLQVRGAGGGGDAAALLERRAVSDGLPLPALVLTHCCETNCTFLNRVLTRGNGVIADFCQDKLRTAAGKRIEHVECPWWLTGSSLICTALTRSRYAFACIAAALPTKR